MTVPFEFEPPVTGDVSVDISVATVVSDFLLVLLQLPDSPLNRDQLEAFSAFRDVVKAGPQQDTTKGRRPHKTQTTKDGIQVGMGPKCMIDRHVAIGYLRAMIKGEMPPELQQKLQLALVDAVASRGPKTNQGINGKFCQGTFGYVVPQAAADYLSGVMSEITVHRSKTEDRDFTVYFAGKPNDKLRPDKAEWRGPKDHVKTKFTEEEQKNQ